MLRMEKRSNGKSGLFGLDNRNVVNQILRFLQLIFALAVVGLYGQDLNRAREEHKYADSKWVYVTTTASLSAITATAFMVLSALTSYRVVSLLFLWDCILTILWVAVIGIFAPMYIHENPEMDAGVQRMKNALPVDYTNLALWGLGAIWGGVEVWRRKVRNRAAEFEK